MPLNNFTLFNPLKKRPYNIFRIYIAVYQSYVNSLLQFVIGWNSVCSNHLRAHTENRVNNRKLK